MKIHALIISLFTSSCSFFGIQNTESPTYKVIIKEGNYEIRKYDPYIRAKTTVKGNDSSGTAFRILAGYIFGKNKGQKKIAMTSPVEMAEGSDGLTMAFSMPAKYKMEELSEPINKNIKFERVESRLVASLQFTWNRSQERNKKKAEKLRKWLLKYKQYRANKDYEYAGYNPTWTIPFLRRNEIHIELTLTKP